MLEKPHLAEARILACLEQRYGLRVAELVFMPLGYDSNAAVYRLRTVDGTACFLKLRRGPVHIPALAIPRYLRDRGIEQVVAPLPGRDKSLWQPLDGFSLILYPFVDGRIGALAGLTEAQWFALGTLLGRVHGLDLPHEFVAQLKSETCVPKWAGGVKALANLVRRGAFDDPLGEALACFWLERADEIDALVRRAEDLGRLLQNSASPLVLCHADFHTYNILVDDDDRLFVVDWDETLLAPKERDLMFVVDAAVGGVAISQRAEELFLRGYGSVEIDWLALAYYRYEWVVQELGEFGALVLTRDDVGTAMREAGLGGVRGLFEPGNVVEAAYRSEGMLPPALQTGERRWS